MRERINSAESVLRDPLRLIRAWREDSHLSWPLGWQLAKRNIQARYRQTILGYAWAILPAFGATIAFVLMKSANLLNTGEPEVPYPVYAFIGALFWQLFATAVTSPMEVVQGNKGLLTKVQFPRESLLIAAGLLMLHDLLVKLACLPILALAFGAWPDADIVYLPLIVLVFLVFGGAIGILLAPCNLIFKDVAMLAKIILSLMILISPVGYVVPEEGWLKDVLAYNPLTPLLDAVRGALTTMPMPDFAAWGTIGLLGLMLMIVALLFYLIALPIVVERQSA
ncbi:MAG: ABC transporter permease [Alphaproteobacteria bacterium]|nr:ABC transporter permease [Alphaproteobacteria bacterium]